MYETLILMLDSTVRVSTPLIFAALAGIITMIGSIPIIVVPLFMYGHPSKKWEYSIKEIQ